jgi:hypothetical protein
MSFLGRFRAYFPLRPDRVTSPSATVGTTATKVITGVAGATGVSVLRLVNLSSDKNLALRPVIKDASVGTMTATGASTDGMIIIPGSDSSFIIRDCDDVYLVGSDANTLYNLAKF